MNARFFFLSRSWGKCRCVSRPSLFQTWFADAAPNFPPHLQRHVLIFGTDGGGEGCQFCFPPILLLLSVSFFFECFEFSLGRDSAPQSHRQQQTQFVAERVPLVYFRLDSNFRSEFHANSSKINAIHHRPFRTKSIFV